MKTIEELQRQIESYRKVLSIVKKPYRSAQDEVAEQLVSRLLYETTNRLKALEQRTVKIHCAIDADADGASRPWPGRPRVSNRLVR